MGMMRYNIHVENNTLKTETCMFEGSVQDICGMLAMLIDHIYTNEIRTHGKKGIDILHKVTGKTLDMVYNEVVDDYLKGGQDDNRNLQE